MSCEEMRELALIESFGALEEEDSRRLEAHVEKCARCAAELAQAREAAQLLALSVPQTEPPQRLKARLLARALADTHGRPAAQGARPAFSRLAVALVAALSVLVVALGAVVYGLQARVAQLEATQASYRDLVRVLVSTNLEVRDLVGTLESPGARARLVYDASSGLGMLMVRDLPEPPPGYVYQVWLVRDGERTSAGTFRTDPRGWGYLILRWPAEAGAFQSVGVTREPETGSPGPTGPRVLVYADTGGR